MFMLIARSLIGLECIFFSLTGSSYAARLARTLPPGVEIITAYNANLVQTRVLWIKRLLCPVRPRLGWEFTPQPHSWPSWLWENTRDAAARSEASRNTKHALQRWAEARACAVAEHGTSWGLGGSNKTIFFLKFIDKKKAKQETQTRKHFLNNNNKSLFNIPCPKLYRSLKKRKSQKSNYPSPKERIYQSISEYKALVSCFRITISNKSITKSSSIDPSGQIMYLGSHWCAN